MDRLTDRPDMTLDFYHGRKTTIQQQQTLCHMAGAKRERGGDQPSIDIVDLHDLYDL